MASVEHRGHDQGGDGGGGEDENGAEQDGERRAGGGAGLRAEVEEERGQPEGGAEHHAGGHVPAAAALDADHLHEGGRPRAEGQVAPELVDADQERAGASGGGDVGQRVAGERLPAHDREDADDGRGDGDDGPDGQRHVHGPAGEEARLEDVPHPGYPATSRSSAAASAPSAGGHHQDPAMDPDHVDVLAVQAGQDLGLDHLIGVAHRDPAPGHVDDPVHDRHQRVHIVRREQHRDALGPGQPREHRHDALLAGDVQVGQRLVEQQQPRLADQGVRDHDPLLLAAGQLADPGVRVPLRADGGQHVGDQLATGPGRQPDAELVPVQPEGHHVPDPQRHVRLDGQLLRYVPDAGLPRGPRPAVDEDRAAGDRLQAEDDPEQGGLARAVRPDKAGELAGADAQRHVPEDLPAAQPDADPVQPEQVSVTTGALVTTGAPRRRGSPRRCAGPGPRPASRTGSRNQARASSRRRPPPGCRSAWPA